MNPTAFFSQPASDYHLQQCYLILDVKPSSKIHLYICLMASSVITRERKETGHGYCQSEDYGLVQRDKALMSSLLNIPINYVLFGLLAWSGATGKTINISVIAALFCTLCILNIYSHIRLCTYKLICKV